MLLSFCHYRDSPGYRVDSVCNILCKSVASTRTNLHKGFEQAGEGKIREYSGKDCETLKMKLEMWNVRIRFRNVKTMEMNITSFLPKISPSYFAWNIWQWPGMEKAGGLQTHVHIIVSRKVLFPTDIVFSSWEVNICSTRKFPYLTVYTLGNKAGSLPDQLLWKRRKRFRYHV